MIDLEKLPDFLVREVEIEKDKYENKKIFECDEQNKKFVALYEEIGESLIDKANEYFNIEDGYESFFNELKTRFLFSIKKSSRSDCESICFDYLLDFLGLKDDLNIIENFHENICKALEKNEIYIMNIKGCYSVFYFGPIKVQHSDYHVRWHQETKIKVFNRIKEKSVEKYKQLDISNKREIDWGYSSEFQEIMFLDFQELIENI